MKFTKFAFIAALAAIVGFTACQKDSELTTAPSVKATAGGKTVEHNGSATTLPINMVISTNASTNKFKEITVEGKMTEAGATETTLKKVTITEHVDGIITVVGDKKVTNVSKIEVAVDAKFFKKFWEKEAANVTNDNLAKFQLTFTIKQETGNTGTFVINYGKESRTAFKAAKEGKFFHNSSSKEGGFDLQAGVAVGSGAEAEKRYMVNKDEPGSFTGSFTSGTASFTNTTGQKVEVRGNGTEFFLWEGGNFDATVEEAMAAFKGGNNTINNPKVNSIIIAKKGEELYLIKITAVNPDGNAVDKQKGELVFQYKSK